jgi:hypothetical protein
VSKVFAKIEGYQPGKQMPKPVGYKSGIVFTLVQHIVGELYRKGISYWINETKRSVKNHQNIYSFCSASPLYYYIT